MSATNSRFRRRRKFRAEKLPIGARREAERLELEAARIYAANQFAYFRARRAQTAMPLERARFGALMQAWEMTLAAVTAKLNRHHGRAAA